MKKNTTTPTQEKLYSVMVGFDTCLQNDILNIIKNDKSIKPVMFTDTYFYVDKATQTELDHIREAVKDIRFEMKNADGSVRRTYKIRYIAAYKYGKMLDITVSPSKFKKPRPGAHSVKVKVATTKPTKRETPRTKKRISIINRGKHNSGANMTSTEIKLVRRARKAGKAVIAAELRNAKQKAIIASIKPKNKASKVAKQLELPLAA